ncbi:MAG TPA: HAD hydrolase-like protein [Telluria sp.]|nr:HAD hydrolase-like protein [Telluria sp.]
MNIVFDLDGTLIDSRQRLYRLFQQLAPAPALSFERYWDFKRSKVSNELILARELGFAPDAIALFVREWMALIESPAFLDLDANFDGMHATLALLRDTAALHVCTARQLREPALGQLERLGLLEYFDSVLVTCQSDSKEALIAAQLPQRSAQDWLIGDTGKDIQVGKALGMRTCAVLSGFLSRASLEPYGPDLILDSAAAFRP